VVHSGITLAVEGLSVTQVELPTTASVTQVAEAIGYSTNTVYALIKTRRLRAVRVGKRLRVPVSEVNAFLEREMGGSDQ
jgi:excisionase family DNA binding protein